MKIKKPSLKGMKNTGYLGHFAQDKYIQQGHNFSGRFPLFREPSQIEMMGPSNPFDVSSELKRREKIIEEEAFQFSRELEQGLAGMQGLTPQQAAEAGVDSSNEEIRKSRRQFAKDMYLGVYGEAIPTPSQGGTTGRSRKKFFTEL